MSDEQNQDRFESDQTLGERAERGLEKSVNLMGHPKGLWVLFITEMWERFSYYGMRALLMLYLIQSTSAELASGAKNEHPGFGWSEGSAAVLVALYVWAVYLTPIVGGWLADKFLGTHRSMIIGGWIIALGHIVLAASEFFGTTAGEAVTLQTGPGALITFIAGLTLIVIGTGFFKPCVSVMVGQLYSADDGRRDAGFTIFYMGINLGAFLAPIVTGYLSIKFGWDWGFGAAAVGMIAGIIGYQFLRPRYLQGVGLSPKDIIKEKARGGVVESKVDEAELTRPLNKVDLQRIIVILVLAFVGNIFFWAAFEQANTSMNVFAERDTDRSLYGLLEGKWEDPETGDVYSDAGEAAAAGALTRVENGWLDPKTGHFLSDEGAIGFLEDQSGRVLRRENSWFDQEAQWEYPDCGYGDEPANADADVADETAQADAEGADSEEADAGDGLFKRIEGGWKNEESGQVFRDNGIITISGTESEFERVGGGFPAAWYQSVNALTIIICAPFFSILWLWLDKRNINPSTPVKFSIGLWILGLAFIAMVFGSMEAAATGGNAAPHWLLMTYIVYTWGELCLSPVGLSMVTKLAPAKLQSMLMGVWFLSFSFANLLGGLIGAFSVKFKPTVGRYCEEIAASINIPGFEGLAGFYVLLVILPITAGVFILIISPILKKMMHGIK